MKSATMLLCLLCLPAAGLCGVYQCKDERGKTVFSDRPCGDDTEQLDIQAPGPMYSGETGNPQATSELYQRATTAANRRMLDTRIRNLQAQIGSLEKERDAQILEYRREIMRSAYNAAGVSRTQKYQELINATQDFYDGKIEDKRAALAKLESERAALR